jgi:serine/threonine protein kinase
MDGKEQLVSETTPGVRFDIVRELSVSQMSNGEQHRRYFRVCLAQRHHHSKEKAAQPEWVALKMPWSKERPDYRPLIQRAFEQEKRSLRDLTSFERVVQFREDGRGTLNRRDAVDYVDYMVLHYVDGVNLRDIMHKRGQTLTPYQALGIACQLAEALRDIHKTGLVHCDLKPSNVMLDFRTQSVVLIDFGSVWFMEDLPIGEERGTTADYMAPEQAHLSAKLTAATDIYAFGVILYELFSGQRLFPNRKKKEVEGLHSVTPSLDQLQRGLAANTALSAALAGRQAELAHIIHLCLHCEPDQRCSHLAPEQQATPATGLMETILDLFARVPQI